MSTREKNLLLLFLEVSKTDNGCTKKWEEVTKKLTKLAYKLGIQDGTPQNRDFIELENDITQLFQMTKDIYFNFGTTAKEIVEEYSLEDVA
ncbi:hypothetical protein I6E17_08845 [Fusobacterium perfoetens]|uniref:hypothetical protein n=1 Tax=Fusobacterium perfoetens TaxID=852 RepID=UPI001F1D02BD|nr:hypothetical protein [Fusobacterium perfoetens]MCF2626258.1 hypothetical protein [Fusobacterium perfoetens]